jgi:hypothetical protein
MAGEEIGYTCFWCGKDHHTWNLPSYKACPTCKDVLTLAAQDGCRACGGSIRSAESISMVCPKCWGADGAETPAAFKDWQAKRAFGCPVCKKHKHGAHAVIVCQECWDRVEGFGDIGPVSITGVINDANGDFKCDKCGGLRNTNTGHRFQMLCADCWSSKNDGYSPIQEGDYKSLALVLLASFRRASLGKGHERHSGGDGVVFEEQRGMMTRKMAGPGFTTGQIIKKLMECDGLGDLARQQELLDVIVYAAIEIIASRDENRTLEEWLGIEL